MAITILDTDERPTITREWMRPLEFSQITGMPRRTVYAMLHAGDLKGIQTTNGKWWLRVSETEGYFRRNGRNYEAA